MHDSLINLNLDDLKGMKSWPTGIQDSNVARFSFDGTHINCDVCKYGRTTVKINMRHSFALAAWNSHVGTEMHKDGIVAEEARLS